MTCYVIILVRLTLTKVVGSWGKIQKWKLIGFKALIFSSFMEGAIGFWKTYRPQITSILRSNNTPCLQIASKDGTWISILPGLRILSLLTLATLCRKNSYLSWLAAWGIYYG